MNREKSLIETLNSLFKMNYPKNRTEVIIVDNGSTDGTIEELPSKLKLIKNKNNKGFAPALNQGIKASKGEYIFVTNDDVVFDRNCLSELVKLAQSDKKIGIVGGKMFFKNSRIMALPGFRVNLWLGYHPFDLEGQNRTREMDVATGGCMLIRKSMLGKIGLFDEGFFFCGEDYDLCFRAKYAGFKIMYYPIAIVWHEFLNTSKKSFNSLFAHYRGKFRFMLVHASLPQLIFFFPIQLTVGTKNLAPMSKAIIWNIKNFNKTLESRNKVNELKK
ncbi:hypothetical protein A3D00_05745 [Candidatus Woesebacteria bacterium RIFCSPHIGHO2_02_FULL_38_9]|uniref:Glycosyltransferase 2-like domain-containing protein n=1 Tax=Candidatus Woesebacteria bacterium RIFCSPHIGHO2_01_FULL_39_28 TaxID=1802496 RepID=A0A1F7YI18_9BACT|nr:MAG: hypothetical protein A2627_02380 [Candidatus Woesebacteria bacterium RIFCSPHIGHO2_01_FULL_39_28]OGM34434.1 MAG: hypothetical protein A3D00_05745 [Candidatus Woesebacteria bacterium RIFCSPHIGHO2_02_FULL_38_9]OGM57174.1 MAG: hypothetical protein A3A50_03240 [Candidatus Woesebacteria bacterium RIFCSPLOWO2_01_FULL_38_20]